MRPAVSITLALALISSATALSAKKEAHSWPELGVETGIVFPNYGAIRNFEANDDRGLWLEDRQRRWYYAELFGPCHDLDFAQAIGFDTRGGPRFDKFSSIYVGHERCQLASLVTAEKPLPRKERLKLRRKAREEGQLAVAPHN